MKSAFAIISLLIFSLIIVGQNYSSKRMEKLVEKLKELSSDYEAGTFVGNEFVRDTNFIVLDNRTDTEIYKNKNHADNKAHRAFLKIVKKAKTQDLAIMSRSEYPNIRVYGFWALIKRKEQDLARNIMKIESKRKTEIVWFDSFGDLILDFSTLRLMEKLIKMENYGS